MNKIHIAIFCFALAFFMSCSENLFGSSSGDSCGKDVKCLRLEAENAFRNSECEKAYKLYKNIVESDSTASIGYFGMAQAGLCMKGINYFDVFRFADLNKLEDNQIPFRNDSIKVQNKYYQGMKFAYDALSELNRRDSLTALYELHIKESSGQTLHISDTLRKNLNSFKNEFGSLFKGFPLSDREYKSESYRTGLLLSTTAKAMLGFFDYNNDNCITKNPKFDDSSKPGVDYPTTDAEWEKWGCIKIDGQYSYDFYMPLNPDGTIDTEQILEQIEEELEDFYDKQFNSTDTTDVPLDIKNINDKIDDFGSDLNEIMGLLGSESNWQAEISKYNDYASFYKVGTRLDEDGDGCIDEELLNGLDNDGDGINNEDARLASLDMSSTIWGKIGSNHVMMYNEDPNDQRNLPMLLPQNAKKYICNEPAPDCPNKRTYLRPDEQGNISVIGFTQEPGYWTSDNLDIKLEVAQDKCGSKYNLAQRKNLVGGCWLFYSEEQFQRLWIRRHCMEKN